MPESCWLCRLMFSFVPAGMSVWRRRLVQVGASDSTVAVATWAVPRASFQESSVCLMSPDWATAPASFMGGGGVACMGRSGCRWIPRRNSLPSIRQFLVMPENCSRCHFTRRVEPTAIAVLTRIHAPEGDVSSSVAAARYGFPVGSSQETSATAQMAVRGSMLRRSMSFVSARNGQS